MTKILLRRSVALFLIVCFSFSYTPVLRADLLPDDNSYNVMGPATENPDVQQNIDQYQMIQDMVYANAYMDSPSTAPSDSTLLDPYYTAMSSDSPAEPVADPVVEASSDAGYAMVIEAAAEASPSASPSSSPDLLSLADGDSIIMDINGDGVDDYVHNSGGLIYADTNMDNGDDQMWNPVDGWESYTEPTASPSPTPNPYPNPSWNPGNGIPATFQSGGFFSNTLYFSDGSSIPNPWPGIIQYCDYNGDNIIDGYQVLNAGPGSPAGTNLIVVSQYPWYNNTSTSSSTPIDPPTPTPSDPPTPTPSDPPTDDGFYQTDVTGPTDPVGPTPPTGPSEPSGPSGPSEPSGPSGPSEPSGPTPSTFREG